MRVLPPQAMSSARLMCRCAHGTRVNVTNRTRFTSAEESLDYFEWRNLLYSGYIESMPVAGHDGKTILDYGCGPGHDVVGFAHFSNPARLIAMEARAPRSPRRKRGWRSTTARSSSSTSVRTTQGFPWRTRASTSSTARAPNPLAILKEFGRIVRPAGSAQIMIYNRDSIFVHLGVGP